MLTPQGFIDQLFDDGQVAFDAPAGPEWTLAAVGDICVVHGVEERLNTGPTETMFRGVRELLDADIVFGNLETAVTDAPDHDPVKPMGLKTSPQHFNTIADLGFNLFCLANNHVMDYQRVGLEHTLQAIDARGIGRVGAGMNLAHARKPYLTEVAGTRVGMLAYCQPESNAASADAPGVAPLRASMVLEDLGKLATEVDVPILSLHEGFEFGKVSRLEFKRNCHRFVDAGAKVVFGHHPHVPHGVEYYNGAVIFYSIGNFLFDFPYHRNHEWTRKNFVARLGFSGADLQRCELHPIVLTDANELVRCESEERRYVLEYLREISGYLLSDNKIEELNGAFITRIAEGIFRGFYAMGAKGDEAGRDLFIRSTMRRDPYLKACRDFVKFALGGEDIASF